MFGILFGWRKASKCKKLIKQVQCRLKLLKNKKGVITRQLREDVVLLVQNGYDDQTVFNRVEQIVRDETRMAAYEILDNFCQFILLNLSYIRKHKECPNDVNEAVSSLMFASARCGDLPELQLIRKLFGDRYGRSFETTAVELSPGNLVNSEIKEKLLTNSVSDDDKQRMMNEIARDCLQPELLALEYRSDWHQIQVLARGVQVDDDEEKTDQHKKQVVNADEIPKREDKDADSTTSTSCESLPQFPEERIVYLDDVEELRSSTTTDGDQRLFKFKSAATFPSTEISTQNYNQIETNWSDSENSSTSKTEDVETQIKGNNFSSHVENRSEGENWDSEGDTDKEMKVSSSLLRTKREALYLRAVTLPPERPKDSKKVKFPRTNSCPYKQPSHVHPKLPDYDDIAAKFMALKREHLQNNTLKS